MITHLITLLSCNYIYVSCPQVTVLLVSLWQPLFPERRSVVLVRIWFVHIFCNLFCDMSSFWLSINISKMEDQQFTRPQVPLVPQNINSRWWCWWYWGDFLALRALPALSDLQFLWLSQFFQLFQVSQISHSSEALGSLSSSNSIIKELEELREPKAPKEWEIQESWKSWKNWESQRNWRSERAGRARRAEKSPQYHQHHNQPEAHQTTFYKGHSFSAKTCES